MVTVLVAALQVPGHRRRLARWPAASRLSPASGSVSSGRGWPSPRPSARDLQRASQQPAPCREPPRCAGSAPFRTPLHGRAYRLLRARKHPGAQGPLASRGPSPFHPRRRGTSSIRAQIVVGTSPIVPGHAVARDHALLPSRDDRFVARARRWRLGASPCGNDPTRTRLSRAHAVLRLMINSTGLKLTIFART